MLPVGVSEKKEDEAERNRASIWPVSGLLIAGQFFQIGFDFADLIRHHAFEVTQIVEDLTFQIDFGAIALTDLIQLVDDIA